jgi:predicted phosphoribosyltransferase
LALSAAEVERIAAAEWRELRRRERAYRDERSNPVVQGRCVILIDDGLATGATMQAAVAAIRQQGPAEVVVAVPVAPPDTVALLRERADAVICPVTPDPFFGVGQWYEDFAQATDAGVRDLLGRMWRNRPGPEGSPTA